MPSVIELQPLRSQLLSTRVGEILYLLRIYHTSAGMVCDISRDEADVLTGFRIVSGTPLIPYGYLESGNFVLIVPDDETPDYNQFGITQTLLSYTQEELEALRNGL